MDEPQPQDTQDTPDTPDTPESVEPFVHRYSTPSSADYDLVSGYYGPGAMLCWYILILTVYISWRYDVPATSKRFKISNEFIAVLLYPIIATGHLLAQVIQFPREAEKYLVTDMADFVLGHFPDNGDYKNDDPYRSATILPRTVNIGEEELEEHAKMYPYLVSLNISLRTSELMVYLVVGAHGLSWLLSAGNLPHTRKTLWICRVCAALGVIAQLSLSIRAWEGCGWGPGILLMSFTGWTFMSSCLMWAMPVLYFVLGWMEIPARMYEVFVIEGREFSWGYFTEGWRFSIWLVLFMIARVILVALLAGIVWAESWMFPYLLVFPKTGISITELDRMSAVAGGLLSLGWTVWAVVRRRIKAAEGEMEFEREMEMEWEARRGEFAMLPQSGRDDRASGEIPYAHVPGLET